MASSTGAGTGATWMLHFNSTDAIAAEHVDGPISLMADVGDSISSNGSCLTALLKSIGPPPWTITAGVAGGFAGRYFSLDPIVLYDSVTDRAVTFKWYAPGTNSPDNVFGPWFYDSTVPGAQLLAFNPPVGSGVIVAPVSYFQWYRVRHDGTYLIFEISFENVIFLECFRMLATAFAPSFDKVGFGFDRGMTGPGQTFAALWSWIET